jgi:hypothetical protein
MAMQSHDGAVRYACNATARSATKAASLPVRPLEFHMPVAIPRIRAVTLVLAFAVGLLLLAANAMASNGALSTQTNDPSGNTVQRFDRAADGSLTPAGTFATGGIGLAGRAPSSSAVTTATCTPSTLVPTACRSSVSATTARD